MVDLTQHLTEFRIQEVELIRRCQSIKAMALDFDGVLTDNTDTTSFLNSNLEGEFGIFNVSKTRSHYDGRGISFLRAIGIRVAIITGESGVYAKTASLLVNKWNCLPSVSRGHWHGIDFFDGCGGDVKGQVVGNWLDGYKLTWNNCCVMGDDFTDRTMILLAGLSFAPNTAERRIKDMCSGVTVRGGGSGAVRDVTNLILEARNIDPAGPATR